MYRVVAFVGAPVYTCSTQNNKYEFDSVDEAKKVAADFVARNKSTFQNGYSAVVIDTEKLQVVSSVRIELPSLAWVDAK